MFIRYLQVIKPERQTFEYHCALVNVLNISIISRPGYSKHWMYESSSFFLNIYFALHVYVKFVEVNFENENGKKEAASEAGI